MEKKNIIDELKAEHVMAEANKVITSMKILLDKVLSGVAEVLRSAVNNDLEEIVLFVAMEDTEIQGYPIQFLLGLEQYNDKHITQICNTGIQIIEEQVKQLDNRIKITTKKENDYLIIWADWKVEK
jgi:hypothetical protein